MPGALTKHPQIQLCQRIIHIDLQYRTRPHTPEQVTGPHDRFRAQQTNCVQLNLLCMVWF